MEFWLKELYEFNYSILDDPEFKEDSVREEIMVPLLKALGYSYTGKYKIVRGRKLKQPFFMVGVKKYDISIYPDYILEYNEQPACIIEVKAPTENLRNAKHIGQAYSYAVHREVRASYYALCNGREFHLYSVWKEEPLMIFQMEFIRNHFELLRKTIGSGNILLTPEKCIKKDLGIHLKMLSGGDIESYYIFMNVPIYDIVCVDQNLYTVSANPIIDDEEYCGSFDFDIKVLQGFSNVLSKEAMNILQQPFDGRPVKLGFTGRILNIGMKCLLGEKIYENKQEHYLPLRVIDLISAEWM